MILIFLWSEKAGKRNSPNIIAVIWYHGHVVGSCNFGLRVARFLGANDGANFARHTQFGSVSHTVGIIAVGLSENEIHAIIWGQDWALVDFFDGVANSTGESTTVSFVEGIRFPWDAGNVPQHDHSLVWVFHACIETCNLIFHHLRTSRTDKVDWLWRVALCSEVAQCESR